MVPSEPPSIAGNPVLEPKIRGHRFWPFGLRGHRFWLCPHLAPGTPKGAGRGRESEARVGETGATRHSRRRELRRMNARRLSKRVLEDTLGHP